MVKVLLVVHMMWMSLGAQAMVSASSIICEQKFIAKVDRIEEAAAPLNPRSVDKVILKPEEILRGEAKAEETIQVLTFSELKLTKGESYVVELQDGKICSVEPLNVVHE